MPKKEYVKWKNRVERKNLKEHRKFIDKINNIKFQAYKLKWHGITSFNTNDWVTGAGMVHIMFQLLKPDMVRK